MVENIVLVVDVGDPDEGEDLLFGGEDVAAFGFLQESFE
jgi:hypothetical protein